MSDETAPPPAEGGQTAPPPAAASAPLPPVPSTEPDAGYTPGGVPTLEGVREKIEARYGTALGAAELAEDTPEARNAEERYAARQKAAEERLQEIRASMHPQQD